MNPLQGWQFLPPPPRVREHDEPLPPAAVTLAGLGALVGALPTFFAGGAAAVLGAFGLVERLAAVIPGATLVLSTWMVQALILISAVAASLVLPVLQFVGAVRLFTRDDRKLVLYGCLPMTVAVPLAAPGAGAVRRRGQHAAPAPAPRSGGRGAARPVAVGPPVAGRRRRRAGMTSSPASRQRTDGDWPPVLVILAGVGAFIGAAPGLLFGAAVLLTGGAALYALTSPIIAIACVVLPWLLVVGALRLMTQRSRWLLICAGLPVTALATWALQQGELWLALLMLGPAAAPLFALAPSVGRWLAERPFLVR